MPRRHYKAEETRAFINNAFRDGAIPTTGTAIRKILPPTSRFDVNSTSRPGKDGAGESAAFFERH